MWIISFFPNWVFHLLLTAGILGTVAGFVLSMVPLIQKYIFPIRIISILLLSFSLYIEGGLTNEESWQLKVKEVEAKIIEAKNTGPDLFRIPSNIRSKIVEERDPIRVAKIWLETLESEFQA